ncbi:MAG TPA: FAD:protein FMN transferase [Planctomycetota bacterium]|nr:FAD:protein FMN transferase [Planctomycetota bacterium]
MIRNAIVLVAALTASAEPIAGDAPAGANPITLDAPAGANPITLDAPAGANPITLDAPAGANPITLDAPAGASAHVERRLAAMGTSLEVVVEAGTRESALLASEAAVRAIEAAEARLSTWRRDTELARLNANPAGEPFRLSPELARDLERARALWRETNGAFDPGVGALVDAWGVREGGRRPDPSTVARLRDVGGLAALELHDGVAVRRSAELRIEEGAFGKGIALDDAVSALRAAGATRALLDFGGKVAVLGAEAAAFPVGVADPRDRSRMLATARLESGSLATSGDSERGLRVDGKPCSHILDPHTGAPVRSFGSMTVWASDATTADALATGLYVFGPDAALAFAHARPGIEVLVIEADGARRRLRATPGLVARLEPRESGVVIEAATPPSLAGPASR